MENGISRIVVAFGVIALIAGGVAANGARADDQSPLKEFTYRVKVPAAGYDCASHADAIASLFANSTRAPEATGACQGRTTMVDRADHNRSYDVDTIVVTYFADTQLTPYRAVFGGSGTWGAGEQDSGIFTTYADCLSAMQGQRAGFEAETGLATVAAYCTASTNDLDPGYSLTFEAFGEPKARLFTYSEDMMTSLDATDTQVMGAVNGALLASGAHIVLSDAAHVFYYSETQIQVAVSALAVFPKASECTSQAEQAREIDTKAGLLGVSALCETVGEGKTASTSLTVVASGPSMISDIPADTRYESFSECMGDLGRVLANVRSSGGEAYGALCVPAEYPGGAGYLAHLYYGL